MSTIQPGEIISHNEMCNAEKLALQKGMNFGKNGKASIFLMSVRPGAPYADKVEDDGNILIYEGHDVPNKKGMSKSPKVLDQQQFLPSGKPTENGKFYQAAIDYKAGRREVELVKVYEKIKTGIWVFNGVFELVDAWLEKAGRRNVFKFKLLITDKIISQQPSSTKDLDHNRMIPSSVKLEVWKRDGGKCVKCGSKDNLHFDHDLPFSLGGTSLTAKNIKLLCARHNLQKSNKIQ